MEQPYKNIFIAWAALFTAVAIIVILALIFGVPLHDKLPPGGEPFPIPDPGH